MDMIAHIGYHKTGTTFLQNFFFPYLSDVSYVPYKASNKIFEPLIFCSSLNFSPSTFHENMNKVLAENSINSQQEPLLFSYEGLVGQMGQGMNNKEIADRLKIVGFTKIIISIRNQVKLIDSVYKQYIQQGGVAKVNTFFDPHYRLFHYGYCDYLPLIKYYQEIFGTENVMVFLQEDLKKEQDTVYQQLCQFMQVTMGDLPKPKKTNVSLSRLSINLLRILNRFTYNYYSPSHLISKGISTWNIRGYLQYKFDPWFFSKISSKKPLLSPEYISKINDYYASNNSKLSKLLTCDLAAHKYPVKQYADSNHTQEVFNK